MSRSNQLYAPVFQGLIDPKHIKVFGPNPLFMYLHFLIRETPRRHGQVYNGTPITDPELAESFGVGISTIQRWRKLLVSNGYVEAKRAPRGYVYTVTKSKKFRSKTGTTDWSDLTEHPIKNSSSVIGHLRRTDRSLEALECLYLSNGEGACDFLNKKEGEATSTPKEKQEAVASRLTTSPAEKMRDSGILDSSVLSDGRAMEQCWLEGRELVIHGNGYIPPIVQIARALQSSNRKRGDKYMRPDNSEKREQP